MAKKAITNKVLLALKENKFVDLKYISTANGKSILAVKSQDEKWGVIGNDGQMVQECMVKGYDYCRQNADPYSYGTDKVFSGEAPYAVDVYSEGTEKRTYVNEDGVIVLPIYDFATRFVFGHAIIRQGGKFSIIDAQGNIIKELPWTSEEINMPEFRNSLANPLAEIKFIKGTSGKKTYVNINGDILELDVRKMSYCQRGFITFVDKENKAGIMDSLGNIKVPAAYKNLDFKYSTGNFNNYQECTLSAIIAVSQEGKAGLIAADGKILASLEYDSIKPLTDILYISPDLFACEKSGKYGVVNAEGKIIVPCEFDDDISYCEDYQMISATKVGKANLYKADGTLLSAGKYDSVQYSKGGIYAEAEGKHGYINPSGEEVIPCMYDDIESLEDNLFRVSCDEKYGIADATNKEILPAQYKKIQLKCGVIVAETEDRSIYVQKLNGDTADFSKYDEVEAVNTDALICRFGRAYLLTDLQGNVLSKREYTFMSSIQGTDLIIVKNAQGDGIIDTEGNEVTPISSSAEFDYREPHLATQSDFYRAVRNGKTIGCVNKTAWVVAPEYSDINLSTLPDYGVVLVLKGKKWGMVDLEGNKVMCAAPKK